MAKLIDSYVEFRIRRSPEGALSVSVKTHEILERSFERAAGGSSTTISYESGAVLRIWQPPSDASSHVRSNVLALTLFAHGSSRDDGITIECGGVRTKQMIRDTVEIVRRFVETWVEQHMRPVEVVAKITMTHSDVPQGALTQ